MRPGTLIAVVSASLGLFSQDITAQAVTGIVTATETGEPLGGANVMLAGVEGQANVAARTATNGEFLITVGTPGVYSLRVNFVGFKPAEANVILQTGDTVEVQVSMVPLATELEPVTVFGSRLTREQLEFESRREVPWGFSFDRDEIDSLKYATTVMEVVEQGVPWGTGLATSRGGTRGCYAVYLDGRESETYGSKYPLQWVYGMEVYVNFTDIPIKYRNPFYGGGHNCGAILLWSNLTPDAIAVPTFWTGAVGAAPGIAAWAAEVTWRPGLPSRYVTVARFRFGVYSPYQLLGSDVASFEGYLADSRAGYFSIYIGKQGPAPLLPWKDRVYLRVAPGATVYWGGSRQQGQLADTASSVGAIAPFFGIGGELALGYRFPTGKIRPWLEARTGAEYITRTGLRWLNVAVLLGFEFAVGGLEP